MYVMNSNKIEHSLIVLITQIEKNCALSSILQLLTSLRFLATGFFADVLVTEQRYLKERPEHVIAQSVMLLFQIC